MQTHLYAWMPAALTDLPQNPLKFLIMLIIGHHPANFLLLVYQSEIDLPLVAPMPIR